jgi:hypothetical protein
MDVPDRPIYGNSFGVNTGVTNVVTSASTLVKNNIGTIGPNQRINDIKGEMFIVEQPESHFLLRPYQLSGDEIKLELARDLVDKLMKSNYIEFTKQTDPHDMSLTYRARIFAVPNDNIQSLRVNIK